MSDRIYEITVRVTLSTGQRSIALQVCPDDTVISIIVRILDMVARAEDSPNWRLTIEDRVLSNSYRIGSILERQQSELLIFSMKRVVSHAGTRDDIDLARDGAVEADEEAFDDDSFALEETEAEATADDEIADFEDVQESVRSSSNRELKAKNPVHEDDEDKDEKPKPPEAGSKRRSNGHVGKQKSRSKETTRRATVRYFNRMNPERVYPLLVMITKKMVERAAKSGTDQVQSTPFRVKLNETIEIEPVLPGCSCYPPKLSARLGAEDFVATFYVLPHMLGPLQGGVVTIRQDNIPLAEIELHGRVVKTTWVMICGFATFVLPFLLAVARNYRVDLTSQLEDGFDFYLAVLSILLSNIAPIVATAGFAILTALLYLASRARQKDVFWDIETIGPRQKLRRIAKIAQSDLDEAGSQLVQLLEVYPDFQSGHLYYARWHYQDQNYLAALAGFQAALELGSIPASDYLKASLSASRLGKNRTAISILEHACEHLPRKLITPVFYYNMGCYHTRLGKLEEAMQFLKRACRAGYRNRKTFLEDVDLHPLRTRSDFKALIEALPENA